jgi:hypothetical protein
MSEQIARISRMENLLNESVAAVEALDRALEEYQAVQDKISQLRQYYDDGDWMEDFNADYAGKLPADLPRGVLTEDAIYDLLTDQARLREKFTELSKE